MKSSLAPGSKVVTEYYDKAGLTPFLEALGFHTVGYGCTTCIGNSGPLAPEISEAVEQGALVVCAVLSGNRNFEARIHPEVKANYLASPPLVVAYALTGRIDLDLTTEPLGHDPNGGSLPARPLADPEQIKDTIAAAINEDMYRRTYADVFTGDEHWAALPVPEGDLFAWDPGLDLRPPAALLRRHVGGAGIRGGRRRRPLPRHGRRQRHDRPHLAGRLDQAGQPGGVPRRARRRAQDFNSYGSRRGNHE